MLVNSFSDDWIYLKERLLLEICPIFIAQYYRKLNFSSYVSVWFFEDASYVAEKNIATIRFKKERKRNWSQSSFLYYYYQSKIIQF